jgi:hypothetical protein
LLRYAERSLPAFQMCSDDMQWGPLKRW